MNQFIIQTKYFVLFCICSFSSQIFAQNNSCLLFASDFLADNGDDHTSTLKNAIEAALKDGCTLIINSPTIDTSEGWTIKEIFIEGDNFPQKAGAEIIFKVPVMAQADFFRFENGLRDSPPSMFVFEECDNFKIIGKANAVISMTGLENQSGLDNLIRTSEWYHAFKMFSCDNVIMEGLIINGTGGDGIVIDAKRFHEGIKICNKTGHQPKNFTIKNCFINQAWRNGIAIGSGQNILIEECTISNTRGTAPQAAIDIEIESCGAILENLVVRNNTMIDNGAYGVECSFSTVMASNSLNVNFIGNEIIGGKGYALDTRNKSYLTGNINFSKSTVDITHENEIAPIGLQLTCPKPSQIGNDLKYNLGDDLIFYNSASNRFFSPLRIKAKEVDLIGCEEGVAAPCRQFRETVWNFFGGVHAEKLFIWDNHEQGRRNNKAVVISRGGRLCMNPTDLNIHAIKRNSYCDCGTNFNLGTSYNSGDNCDVCASYPENRDKTCQEEGENIDKRTYETKSEECQVDVTIDVIRTDSADLPQLNISQEALRIDENGFINITVCRDIAEDYPLAVKLEWNASFESFRHLFFSYPKFVRLPAGERCNTRKLKVRADANQDELTKTTLSLANTEFHHTSTAILEFDEILGESVTIPQDTTIIEQNDTTNFSDICLPEGIIFKSQFQLDSFRLRYPNCTEIEGTVKVIYDIENPITHFSGLLNVEKMGGLFLNYGIYNNLIGLENLKEINRTFSIYNADSLKNFIGLENLEKVGSLLLNDLNIRNMEGLSGLKQIDHNFQVYDNERLISLDGLSSLEEVGLIENPIAANSILISRNDSLKTINFLEKPTFHSGSYKGNIRIISNPSLTEIASFIQTSNVDGLVEITSNKEITSLAGLENLIQTNRLIINNNENLGSLSGLEQLQIIEHGLEIHNNSKLDNLETLTNLNDVGSMPNENEIPFLKISSNPKLTSMIPLRSLNFQDNFFDGTLILRDNPRVINLLGLEKLEGIYQVEITNLGIKDFEEFSNLAKVPNSFTIRNNYLLKSLNGLENLTQIGDLTPFGRNTLTVEGNSLLQSLIPLSNLSSDGDLFQGSLQIINNDKLVDLKGLENIDSIGWNIEISENQNLQTLSGLENLIYVKADKKISFNPSLENVNALINLEETFPFKTTTFEIINNHALKNLNGLRNFKFPQIARLRLYNNPLIDVCDYPMLCEYVKQNLPTRLYFIFGNGEGCSSINEIRESCRIQFNAPPANNSFQKPSIYPNPNNGEIYFSGFELEEATITILDLTGKVVYHEYLDGKHKIKLPENLIGFYFLRIETDTLIETHKILKQ